MQEQSWLFFGGPYGNLQAHRPCWPRPDQSGFPQSLCFARVISWPIAAIRSRPST